jgi:hypothetical protein
VGGGRRSRLPAVVRVHLSKRHLRLYSRERVASRRGPDERWSSTLSSRSSRTRFLVHSSRIFERLFPEIPLKEWKRKGTWIEHWNDNARIAFAPHQSYCSLYFQERGVLDWDPDPIRYVVAKILGAKDVTK